MILAATFLIDLVADDAGAIAKVAEIEDDRCPFRCWRTQWLGSSSI